MSYKIKYQENGKIFTKKVDSLDSLPLNTLQIKKEYVFNSKNLFNNLSHKELKNLFYELNLMLQSNILLDEAFDILIKKEKNFLLKEFLSTLKDSFSNSKEISKTLEKFNIPYIVKAFFKITQDAGNPKGNIFFLTKLISEEYEIKREFRKVLVYPIILLITYIFALIGIFRFVIPKFEFMFLQNGMELSFATKSLLFVKEIFFSSYISMLIIPLVFFLLAIYSYKNDNRFSFFVDKICLKRLGFFSSLYRYKVYYTYFSIIEIFLKSKYEFHESFTKSKVLINNQYLLDKITKIDSLLKNGKSISFAFESVGIFDDITINLLKTGEITNSLETTVGEIKKINKRRFDDKLKLFSLFVEPVFFVIMMLLILWIILAIFVPLWSMGDMLRM